MQSNMTLYAKYLKEESGSTEISVEETRESIDATEQEIPVQSLDEENEGSSLGKGYGGIWWILLLIMTLAIIWGVKKYHDENS